VSKLIDKLQGAERERIEPLKLKLEFAFPAARR
jgi:hypothetical protein